MRYFGNLIKGYGDKIRQARRNRWNYNILLHDNKIFKIKFVLLFFLKSWNMKIPWNKIILLLFQTYKKRLRVIMLYNVYHVMKKIKKIICTMPLRDCLRMLLHVIPCTTPWYNISRIRVMCACYPIFDCTCKSVCVCLAVYIYMCVWRVCVCVYNMYMCVYMCMCILCV